MPAKIVSASVVRYHPNPMGRRDIPSRTIRELACQTLRTGNSDEPTRTKLLGAPAGGCYERQDSAGEPSPHPNVAKAKLPIEFDRSGWFAKLHAGYIALRRARTTELFTVDYEALISPCNRD